MNKDTAKLVIRNLLCHFHQIKHDRFYHLVMRKNGISDKKMPGEDEWLKKWSQFGIKAKTTQYRVFSHYIGEDINIVPEDICHDFIEPLLDPFRFTGYYSDKNIYDKLFPEGFFPKTLLRRMNGFYYDKEYHPMQMSERLVTTLLRTLPSRKAILKPSIDGMSGKGIFMIELTPAGRTKITSANGQKLASDPKDIGRLFKGDFIMQEAVEQNDYLMQFNPSSVNTLRLSVYRSVKDNSCHVTGAILRIGGPGSVVDNAHSGGGYVGIQEDGRFCHAVLDQYGVKTTVFNGIDFSQDFSYPNWEEITEFGKQVCQFVPHHRLLALDIVLDIAGKPHLIEFNVLYYGLWVFQYTTGPAFGKFTDEIIDYCVEHKKDLEYLLWV